jgi:type I restriction enzyme S subunit
MTEWREQMLSEFMHFNPRTPLLKGSIAKKVAMEHLASFNRKIQGYEEGIFKGGAKFKNGDTLVARITPCLENGKTAYVDFLSDNEVAFGSTEFIVLRAKEGISDSKFIFYLAISDEFRDTAIQLMTGSSGRQRVETEALKQKVFILPALPEQKAIAEVLSSLDDKIDLLTRQNNTLEDLGQAFFRKWFVEDADEKLKKYPLSELMVIQNGFAFRSRDYQDAGKYKIVTIKNVQDGFIDTSGTTFLNQLPVGMPDYVLLTIGDVLISLTGNVGRVGIVVEDNLLLNQRVAKISPYNPEYLPFLYFYFRNETTREYLINLAHGTAQANLSPIETLKTEVSFSKTLIKKYSELFMPMYQKIIKNKQQIIVLQKLRDTLLPKLISGEVRVKL